MAHAVGAGERKGRYCWVGGQLSPDGPAAAHDDVEHTFGEAGFVERLGEFEGQGGGLRGRLDNDRVAADESRGQLPRGDGDGKIPGRDQTDHSERQASGEKQIPGQVVRDGLASEDVAQTAKEAENIAGALHFPRAFRKGLALLAREQFGELRFAGLEDLGSLA